MYLVGNCEWSDRSALNMAAMAEMIGADIEVPSHLAYLLLGIVDKIFIPGA